MALFSIDILGLTQGTSKNSDEFVAVDVTDTTMSTIGTDKKYSIAGLFSLFLSQMGYALYQPVVAASVGNLNATYNNGIGGINATLTDNSGTFAPLVIDGVNAVVNQAYLIKDQLLAEQNGIYVLTQNGNGTSLPWILIRAAYFNSNANIINNKIVIVQQGTVNANTAWATVVIPPVVVGTTLISFVLFTIIATPPSSQPWHVVNIASPMIINNGYISNNNVLAVNLLLPPLCVVGSTVEVTGLGTAGWRIIQNPLQQINYGILSTTPGLAGSLSSTVYDDSVRLVCVQANTVFNVLSSQGNLNVI